MANQEDSERMASELQALSVEGRIEAVAKDLESGSDRYSVIDGCHLAELLGLNPGQYHDWARYNFVPPLDEDSLQQVIEEMSMKGYEKLKLTVLPARLIVIDQALKDDDLADKLTAPEIAVLIEVEEQTRLETDGFYIPLAETSVTSAGGIVLGFQSYVEDDGELLSVLGPYEGRDGSWYDCTDRPTDCF